MFKTKHKFYFVSFSHKCFDFRFHNHIFSTELFLIKDEYTTIKVTFNNTAPITINEIIVESSVPLNHKKAGVIIFNSFSEIYKVLNTFKYHKCEKIKYLITSQKECNELKEQLGFEKKSYIEKQFNNLCFLFGRHENLEIYIDHRYNKRIEGKYACINLI